MNIAYICKCGHEQTIKSSPEIEICEMCLSSGLFEEKQLCTQCNGTKKFWYIDGFDYCTLCDDNGFLV